MSDTPAFPTSTQISQNNTTGETMSYQYLSDGMTLRDYFAAKAMASIISKFPAIKDKKDGEKFMAACAEGAYGFADAMLSTRRN